MIVDNIAFFDIETTGLSPLRHRITCICAKSTEDDTFKFISESESQTIIEFTTWLCGKNINMLVGANSKEFDLPFIIVRSYINKIDFDVVKFLLDLYHFDVDNDITDKRMSLNNLGRLYGFPLKCGDGLKAIRLFQCSNYAELLDYCMGDVVLTRNVYLKYKELIK